MVHEEDDIPDLQEFDIRDMSLFMNYISLVRCWVKLFPLNLSSPNAGGLAGY